MITSGLTTVQRPKPFPRCETGRRAGYRSVITKHSSPIVGLAMLSLISAIWASGLSHGTSPYTQARAPHLILPVECEIGRTCLIQKLVDHDASSGRRDFRCGTLTTDGHDGTDIRLRTMEDMRSGYAVVAAATGTVLRTRDGEPDAGSSVAVNTSGRDAGNGIVIDHGDGWETQYSHLMQGTVQVKPGQRLVVGDELGMIGLSGNTEFPHLHFTVRHRGTAIDPFTGARQGSACSAVNASASLWTAEASRVLSYVPTSIISIGLASSVPSRSVVSRTSKRDPLDRQSPILLWADVIGAKTGDVQIFMIAGPDGQSVHTQEIVVDGGGLSWFAYSGKRAPASGWPTGRYTGRYVISRNGKIISRSSISSEIR